VSEYYREVSIMKRPWPIKGGGTRGVGGGGGRGRKNLLQHNTSVTELLLTHNNGTVVFLLTHNNATSMFLNATLVRLCSVTRHCCDIFLLTHNKATYFFLNDTQHCCSLTHLQLVGR
jgi:hypothetical protein